MISTVSFHPFISHFPPALFFAGLTMLFLAHKKNDGKLASSAAFNLSLGLFAAVIANFSGMVSVDINLRTVTDVEGHQGYAFFIHSTLWVFCWLLLHQHFFPNCGRFLYGRASGNGSMYVFRLPNGL